MTDVADVQLLPVSQDPSHDVDPSIFPIHSIPLVENIDFNFEDNYFENYTSSLENPLLPDYEFLDIRNAMPFNYVFKYEMEGEFKIVSSPGDVLQLAVMQDFQFDSDFKTFYFCTMTLLHATKAIIQPTNWDLE